MTNLNSNNALGHWGIILSGGSGMRLRDFVHRRRADYLPKQYLNFIGKRSMLEHTWHRAERLIPAYKLLIVATKEHFQFDEVRCQIAARPQECIIIQPENRDTGPGILLPLMHIHKRDPAAVVAVFPSDHFILEEALFMEHVQRAFEIAESNPSRIVLLAVEPNEPDPEYGYILPGEALEDPRLDGSTVEIFVEKPSAEAAKKIIRKGALWNTLVFVVACKTLLQAIKRATPEMFRAFEPIQEAIGTAGEQRAIEQVYQKLAPVNFSKGVLETLSHENRRNLRIVTVRGVTWKDWGSSERLTQTLRQLGAPDLIAPEAAGSEGRAAHVAPERQIAAIRRIHAARKTHDPS
jgi:mannose-1-phosphate guanylyltransferase